MEELKTIDTSVVFRLFDENTDKNLRNEIKQLLLKEKIFIPCEVIIELSYLLKTRLRKTKREIIEIISQHFLRDNIELEPKCLSALILWENSTLDKLVDALILVKARERNSVLITLDKEMQKVYSNI